MTGARGFVPEDLRKNLRALARFGRKPVLIGFGVSSPKQVKAMSRLADGVIVGSAIVDKIRQSGGRLGSVVSYVNSLLSPLRNSKRK